MEALKFKIASNRFRCFVDDSHARFQEMYHADKFLEILNKQDQAMKYRVEFEYYKKYEFKVHLTVCSHHVTYMFQNESILYSCLNVKELLARNRREI